MVNRVSPQLPTPEECEEYLECIEMYSVVLHRCRMLLHPEHGCFAEELAKPVDLSHAQRRAFGDSCAELQGMKFPFGLLKAVGDRMCQLGVRFWPFLREMGWERVPLYWGIRDSETWEAALNDPGHSFGFAELPDFIDALKASVESVKLDALSRFPWRGDAKKENVRPPTEEQKKLASIVETLGYTQTEAARRASQELGKPISQAKVSRAIKAVNRWRRANGLFEISTRGRGPTQSPTDPRVIDAGGRVDTGVHGRLKGQKEHDEDR